MLSGLDARISAVILIISIALPCAIAEAASNHRHIKSRLDFGRWRWSPDRIFHKLAALWAIIMVLMLCYSFLPVYQADLYAPLHWLTRQFLLPFLVLSIPYVALVDGFQTEGEDALCSCGRLLVSRGRAPTSEELNYLLGWAVKGFFLPLMFSFLCAQFETFRALSASLFTTEGYMNTVRDLYEFLYNGLFLVDVLIATTGYVMTLRILGTDIRSVDPTVAGWLVAIICYEPFWPVLYAGYLSYMHNSAWGNWLGASPVLYTLWASLIIASLSIYVWATVCFGIRFSNLTHRGIITSGPYRWTKHPAYLSKNLSWWLISIPFMPSDNSFVTAMYLCAALAGVNVIYLLRAKTEERHLSRDPAYRAYADYIRDHGLFARLKSALRRGAGRRSARA